MKKLPRTIKVLLPGLIFVLVAASAVVYMFSTNIQFVEPVPVAKQQNDTARYNDSINYILRLKFLEGQEFDLKHHEKIYEWQHKSTIMIFIIVVIVVFTGLYLSFKQFQFTNRLTLLQAKHELLLLQISEKAEKATTGAKHPRSETGSQQPAQDPGATSFEISKGGIKITSAVLGLIILAMSIALIVIYAELIYPIH